MSYTYAGQYGPEALIDVNGTPLVSQSVQVNVAGGGAATIYTSRTKGSTAANPTTADAYGNLTVYADPGRYDLVFATRTVTVEIVPDYAEVVGAFTTKGDLLVATAANTATRFGVGSDAQILVASSAAPTGLAWTTPASPANDLFVAAPYPSPLMAPTASTITLSTTFYLRFRSTGIESLSGLSLYCAAGTSPAAIVALYSDSAGAPSTRLATSTGAPLTTAAVTAVSFTSPYALAVNTDYWLAVAVTGTSVTGAAFTMTAALAAIGATSVRKQATATPPSSATPVAVGSTDVVPQVWAVL